MRCERFRRDGSACDNLTDHADRWCREQDCDGFLRPHTQLAPLTTGAPRGTRAHLRSGGGRVEDLDSDEAFVVDIRYAAVDAFRHHHGGSYEAAEAQIRSMLEDFVLLSSRRVTAGGFIQLSRDGYTLVLAPGAQAVTGYATVHRERTWAQVQAGVPSRFGGRRARPRTRRPVPADLGVGVTVVGTVATTTDFGVFVDLGTCDVLLHRSTLGLADHVAPRDRYSTGDPVRVVVIDIDRARHRVALRPA